MKTKNFIFLALSIGIIFSSKAQVVPDLDWAKRFGAPGADIGHAIATDADGNVYVTGQVNGASIVFGDSTYTAYSGTTSIDIFVLKMNTNGDIVWSNRFGGTGADYGRAIAVDTDGNVYVTGQFAGAATFGGVSLTSNGGGDIFVTKINSSGQVQWAHNYGSGSTDSGYGIDVDVAGNVFVTGHFQAITLFGTTTLTASGGEDLFAMKLSNSGIVLWAKQAGGSGADRGASISADNNGSAYVTGQFATTLTFESNAYTSLGGNDIIVLKLNETTGNGIWVKTYGNTGTGGDVGKVVKTDASGNVYVTGVFRGTITFGTETLIANGQGDVFLLKLTPSGDVIWVNKYGGTSGDEVEAGLAIDVSNNVYLAGRFSPSIILGDSTFTAPLNSYNLFSIKVSSLGNLLAVNNFGIIDNGSTNNNNRLIHAVAVDPSFNVYITGYHNTSCMFGSETLVSGGGSDIFVVKTEGLCATAYYTQDEIACESFTWAQNGDTYTVSGSYTHTAQTALGCDSITTLNLIIGQDQTASVSVAACNEYTWNVNGTVYTASGSYQATIPTVAGCDSTITLNLTISEIQTVTVAVNACDEYTWDVNGVTYTAQGWYTDTILSSAGCDSIVTLNLTITTINNTVSQSGITLMSNQSGATYQWIDCNNGNAPIAGATTQSFSPVTNGNYAVELTLSGCTETSACTAINSVGIETVDNIAWSVYPNPTENVLNIQSKVTIQHVTILNLMGQQVEAIVNEGNTQVDLSKLATGQYLLQVTTNGTTQIRKIEKK